MSVATDPATRGRVVVEPVTDFAQQEIDRVRAANEAKFPDPATRRGVIYAAHLREP